MTDPDQTTGRWTKWYRIGTDEYGSQHWCNFEKATVYVVTASGQLEHVEKLYLQNATVEQWMGFVDDARGWDDRQYGTSLAAGLGQYAEGGA